MVHGRENAKWCIGREGEGKISGQTGKDQLDIPLLDAFRADRSAVSPTDPLLSLGKGGIWPNQGQLDSSCD